MEPYRDPPLTEEGGEAVALTSYHSPVEAELAREHLAEHGIVAAVHESASFNPLINVAAGGTRLLVRASDESRARQLLRRLAATQPEDEDEPGEVRCPRCELTYCTFGTALATTSVGPMMAPLFMLLLLPLGLTRKRWRCERCLHVWDDPDEGPKRRTPIDPEDPHPVFRLRRHRAGTGLALGLGLMFLVGLLAQAAGIPPMVLLVVALAMPVLGLLIGQKAKSDVCSAPECRAPLAPGAKDCKACHGTIAGTIRASNEHWSETANVRRELWEMRKEKAAPRQPTSKAVKTGEKRRKKGAARQKDRAPDKPLNEAPDGALEKAPDEGLNKAPDKPSNKTSDGGGEDLNDGLDEARDEALVAEHRLEER